MYVPCPLPLPPAASLALACYGLVQWFGCNSLVLQILVLCSKHIFEWNVALQAVCCRHELQA